MKVLWTEDALRDLDDIAAYLLEHHPAIAAKVGARIESAVAWIARWPEGARRASGHHDVRVFFLGRYPYRIFYRVIGDTVEVLHVHHAAREPWEEDG